MSNRTNTATLTLPHYRSMSVRSAGPSVCVWLLQQVWINAGIRTSLHTHQSLPTRPFLRNFPDSFHLEQHESDQILTRHHRSCLIQFKFKSLRLNQGKHNQISVRQEMTHTTNCCLGSFSRWNFFHRAVPLSTLSTTFLAVRAPGSIMETWLWCISKHYVSCSVIG